MKILIVLGSPNSDDGKLGTIALDRLDHCFKIYNSTDNQIICTGGFGEHFNTSPKAHAVYAKNYLMAKGIQEASFLDHALSSNTVEDAVKVKEILVKHNFDSLVIISSDFHLDRVRLVFDEILEEFSKEFIGVRHNFPAIFVDKLVEHEKKAIDKIVKAGLKY
jgi:uncharacterized SAM-binding protein YcdF (DUF218 family)